jgi:hypothetical protein
MGFVKFIGCRKLPRRMDEAFFRERYEADKANRAKQSLEQHMEWVERFYAGQRFPPIPGWRKREDELLRHHHVRHDLRHQLHETGRLLASEWAKDNAVRKVSTSDLQAWGRRFEDASKDPDALLAALREVEAETRKRIS